MDYQKIKARELVRREVVGHLESVLFMEDLTVDYKEYGINSLKDGVRTPVACLTLGLPIVNVMDDFAGDSLFINNRAIDEYTELTHLVYNLFKLEYYVIPNEELEPTIGYKVRIIGTNGLTPLFKIPAEYTDYLEGNHWGVITSSRQTAVVNVILKSMYATFNWSSNLNKGVVLSKLFIEGTDEFGQDIFVNHTPKKSFLDEEPSKLTFGSCRHGKTIADNVFEYKGNYNDVLNDLLVRYKMEKGYAKIEEYNLYKIR